VLHVRKVPVSLIAANIHYPEKEFSLFSSVSPEKFWGNTGILK
jgi:hypothetical protein